MSDQGVGRPSMRAQWEAWIVARVRGAVEEPHALGHQVAAPKPHVLTLRRDHGAHVVQPGWPAGLGEADQGGEAQHLGLLRQQLGQQAREAQHLPGEAGALAGEGGVLVGLGVGDLQRGEHRLEALGPGLAAGNLERNPGHGDLPLGPRDPLHHGRLGGEEGPRQPLRGQAADHLQREGGPDVRADGRVAADEDQPEPLVRDRFVGGHEGLLGRRIGLRRVEHRALAHGRAAPGVDGAPERRAPQPGGRVARRLVRPGAERRGRGVREGVLGRVQVAQARGQRRHHARPGARDRAPEVHHA